MLDKEDRDFGGVLSTAKTALTLYSDPLVAQNTSASDFTIADLVNYELPISLVSGCPAVRQDPLRPLIRLMFTMVVNRLTEKMMFQGAEADPEQAPSSATDRRISVLEPDGGIRRCVVVHGRLRPQGIPHHPDIRQIVDAYGHNESIVSNCHVRIAFAPNQVETAELLSKMTGTQTVQKASYNSRDRASPRSWATSTPASIMSSVR